MFTINFDVWSSRSDSVFVIERYYYKGKWTPFCKVRLRYFRTVREMNRSSDEPPLPLIGAEQKELDRK